MIRCPQCSAKIAVIQSENEPVLVRTEAGMSTFSISLLMTVPGRCPSCDQPVTLEHISKQLLLSIGASVMSRNRKSKLSSEKASAIALKRWSKA